MRKAALSQIVVAAFGGMVDNANSDGDVVLTVEVDVEVKFEMKNEVK